MSSPLSSHTHGVRGGHIGAMAILVDLQMVPFALAGAVFWMRRRRHSCPKLPQRPTAAAARS